MDIDPNQALGYDVHMAKWSRKTEKKSTVPEGYSDELTDADIQRIWDASHAQPGYTVTVYGQDGTSKVIQAPVAGTPITAPITAQQVASYHAAQQQAASYQGGVNTGGYASAPTYTSGQIIGYPLPDPLQAVIDQRVEACFRALIRDQDITIAALQEQIDELWAELRDE